MSTPAKSNPAPTAEQLSARELRLYRGLARLATEAGQLIAEAAPPSALWVGIRRLLLSAAALFDRAAP